MLRSHSDPGSLLFDPEIERTLRRTRQARRRAELARLALDNNPFYFSECSSDSDTQSSSSVSGTPTMAERLTLKQLGGACTAFDNLPNRFPELSANFELKSGLINLLPKFCGRPGEDPIKHIKDFEGEGLISHPACRRNFRLVNLQEEVLEKILPAVQDKCHQKGNLWDCTTSRGNFTRILRVVQEVARIVPPSLYI
ncbi:hypothetical protein PIB30_066559 [Stylosanthes scabra]|uniref:Uncharacterized protein n=1 Tax=Stylosanthes scabra TaxID=79078 RepID=A0ABU6ZL16_9FABA|nr:hypothetical protein [Stylosanthes scabra]